MTSNERHVHDSSVFTNREHVSNVNTEGAILFESCREKVGAEGGGGIGFAQEGDCGLLPASAACRSQLNKGLRRMEGGDAICIIDRPRSCVVSRSTARAGRDGKQLERTLVACRRCCRNGAACASVMAHSTDRNRSQLAIRESLDSDGPSRLTSADSHDATAAQIRGTQL